MGKPETMTWTSAGSPRYGERSAPQPVQGTASGPLSRYGGADVLEPLGAAHVLTNTAACALRPLSWRVVLEAASAAELVVATMAIRTAEKWSC